MLGGFVTGLTIVLPELATGLTVVLLVLGTGLFVLLLIAPEVSTFMVSALTLAQ